MWESKGRCCHTRVMPTQRPRHTITETPPVQRALSRLRALDPAAPIDFKELVILGAETKAQALTEQNGGAGRRHQALVEEFLALRADERLDACAGLALHDGGWAREV